MLFEEKHSKSNYYCALEDENINCLMHCQTSFEIVFVKFGSISLELKGKTLTVSEGQCAWILPYEIHRITTPEKSRVLISIFSTDHISDFYDTVKGKTLCGPVIDFPTEMLETLKNAEDRFSVKAALYSLCSKVLSQGTEKNKRNAKTDDPVKIMLYLQEHYTEQIGLQALAKELGYSYSYTSLIFKECFSKSFSDLLNEYRLNEAVRLLKKGTYTITEVSQRCGFSTIRNFNIAFKKQFGVTPREYKDRPGRIIHS